MTQFIRPAADDSVGGWTNEAGSTTNLYISVDEAVASDADYVKSSSWPFGDTVRFQLTADGADPEVSTGYAVTYRIGKEGQAVLSLTARLIQGVSTVIAEWQHIDVPYGPIDIVQTLTASEADAITDHTDLSLEFETSVGSYTWTDLGTDTVIHANTDFFSRYIRRLTASQGVLWLGSGSINAAVGTTYARYFDPADSTFKYGGGRSGGEATDGLLGRFVDGDVFYLLYTDPAGVVTADYLKFASPTSGTLIDTSDLDMEHGFSMCSHNGDLYIAGAANGLTWEATVWRSTDDGATWSVAYQPNVGNRNWFIHIFSYDGYLWVTGYEASVGESGNSYKSADGTTWTDAGFRINPGSAVSTPDASVSFAGYQFVHIGGISGVGGSLARFDGTGSATDISALVDTRFVYDLCATADALYVLADKKVFRSFDGLTFDRIATCSFGGVSIAALDDDIYVGGDFSSKLYRGTFS